MFSVRSGVLLAFAGGFAIMAVVKQAVDVATLGEDDMRETLTLYGRAAPTSDVEKLHNGYSGCNYRVRARPLAGGEDEGGTDVLLKGSVDKPVEELNLQVTLLEHLRGFRYPTAYPIPLAEAGAAGAYVSTAAGGKMAVMMLDFSPGRPANKMIADSPAAAGSDGLFPAATVLGAVGTALAQLHCIPPPTSFRRYADGVGTKDAMFDDLAPLRALPAPLGEHPFLEFFAGRIDSLRQLVSAGDAELPQGLMHCDYFLDNVLLHPADGALAAVLDWEDAAVGPLLHDLGIAVIGCCYGPAGALEGGRLRPFLQAYNAVRPLSQQERNALLTSMQGAALAVGFFRWRQFNVRHPEIMAAKDAYTEMVEKIERLEDPAGADQATLAMALDSLPPAIPDAAASAQQSTL